jgi:poly(3-hydroxybutyrate) depolymerase
MKVRTMIIGAFVIGLAFAPKALLAAETVVVKSGASLWTDRDFTIGKLPKVLEQGQTVPKQKFNQRKLEVPEGTKSAVIGIWPGAVERYTKVLGLKRTGLNINLMRANGNVALKYVILIYENPKNGYFFEHGGAGIALLGLNMKLEGVGVKTYTNIYRGLKEQQEFEGQEWPFKPGKRMVKIYVREPKAGVNADTGFMLMLHNWGGRYMQTKSWCDNAADRYNVIGISVEYLQSGESKPTPGIPYDHGYLQAMDCIRAVHHVRAQLIAAKAKFSERRYYAAGASGGGNVTLMLNKLAPSTFATVMDMCGMPGLVDKIAYGPGLDAGYSRKPEDPNYLTKDMQEIRDPGHPAHLKIQFGLNRTNKVIIVHGLDDGSCPPADKITIFRNMVKTGFKPDGHFLTKWNIGTGGVSNTLHGIGTRLAVLQHFGDAYFIEAPNGKLAAFTNGKNDFEKKGKIVYPTTNGQVVVDYSLGAPVVKFEKK